MRFLCVRELGVVIEAGLQLAISCFLSFFFLLLFSHPPSPQRKGERSESKYFSSVYDLIYFVRYLGKL